MKWFQVYLFVCFFIVMILFDNNRLFAHIYVVKVTNNNNNNNKLQWDFNIQTDHLISAGDQT